MIEHTFDTTHGILHLRPQTSLEPADFERLAHEVDPYIATRGDLAGLIVEARSFPGWSSFGALAAHLRFVRDHHRHIRKIAVVTDSAIGNLAESLVAHFVAAEVRRFPAVEVAEARDWILASPGAVMRRCAHLDDLALPSP